MPRYAMVIDKQACVGCHSCAVACKSEWDVPNGAARTWIRQAGTAGPSVRPTATVHVSQCNQCDRPTCVPACPTGATYQSDTGIVKIDRELCIGCGSCVAACSYDARYINEMTGKADKCDFCASRVEKGLEPACVATCPAQAKTFGDLENPASAVFGLVYRQGATPLETAQVRVGPNVYYLGPSDQMELARANFAPHPPRTLAAARVWSSVLKKVVLLAVGTTFLGQAAAFCHQLATGEKESED